MKRLLILACLTASTFARADEKPKLCKIAVGATKTMKVTELKAHARRLSGGYRPTFSMVAPELNGAHFTQTSWRGRPSYHVTVIESGYLYFFGIDSKELKHVSRWTVEPAPGVVKGAYLNSTFKPHRIWVEAGDHFLAHSYEAVSYTHLRAHET